MSERAMFGRKVIYSDAEEITRENVCKVLDKALAIHTKNSRDIEYLHEYRKGNQPVLSRKKDVRPEINNKIVENRAQEITEFHKNYLLSEPIQYVSCSDEDKAAEINALNRYAKIRNKALGDAELVDWFTVCGTAYRLIMPSKLDDRAPFEIYTLDPRYCFIVYHSGLGHAPLMGVVSTRRENGDVLYCVYTKNSYYEVVKDKILKSEEHYIGAVPIIEYPANFCRLGVFESVLPLLDAINKVVSNRLDGVEQFIQALLVLRGVDIESEDFKKLRELGGICVNENGDVKYLIQELNQTQVQTLANNLYQAVLTICSMPNRNGGSSTSDTGAAVLMRDGWEAAESYAKGVERMFKSSEQRMLTIALDIAKSYTGMNLDVSDVDVRFTRRNYENIQEKSQVLTTLLSSEKVHPRLAFEHSGMFSDPNLAYSISEKYAEEQKAQTERELLDFTNRQTAFAEEAKTE